MPFLVIYTLAFTIRWPKHPRCPHRCTFGASTGNVADSAATEVVAAAAAALKAAAIASELAALVAAAAAAAAVGPDHAAATDVVAVAEPSQPTVGVAMAAAPRKAALRTGPAPAKLVCCRPEAWLETGAASALRVFNSANCTVNSSM